MTLVHVICEGQTEETFVKELLVPHYAAKGIYLIPALIGRPGHKGGNVNYDRLFTDVRNRLMGDQNCYCTTFFDFYGLAESFPGKKTAADAALVMKKAECVQDEMQKKLIQDIGADAVRRFIPYVQMYEYEALLFSDPQRMASGMYQPHLYNNFKEIARQFPSPEHINNSPQTAPSKRIESLIPGYQKPLLGTLSALEVGLESMRAQCPLFDGWLCQLEALAG